MTEGPHTLPAALGVRAHDEASKQVALTFKRCSCIL